MFYNDGYYSNNGTETWYGYGRKTIPTNTDEWQYISYSITTDDKILTATSFNFYVHARDFTGDLYFRNIKMEKGDKATDWTPAPEDVDTDILNVNNKITSLELTADGLTARIDSISVGGINLLSYSDIVYHESTYNSGDSTQYIKATTNTGKYGGLRIPSSLFKNNSEYVLHFDIKSLNGAGLLGGHQGCMTNVKLYVDGEHFADVWNGANVPLVANEKKHITIVFSTIADISSSDNPNIYIQPKRGNSDDIALTFEVENLKLEEGNKETSWSLSNADLSLNITNAAKTATNYMNFSSSGLVIGDMTSSTLGKNVRITSSTVDIREDTTTLASFGANTIYLGKNSETSVINLCNGAATMRVKDETNFRIYTDKRLVMAAYDSMLLDCWRDSTHMTRIAIQSADPDDISMVGGVQFTIYQDNIQNIVSMLKNNIKLQVTDGTNETYININEKQITLRAADRINVNSVNAMIIGESSNYRAGFALGNDYDVVKYITCYWADGVRHYWLQHIDDGLTSFFGPGDISKNTVTGIRGKTVRLISHSGGGVYLGSSGSTAVTSDRNLKKDIVDIDDKYIEFFDRLRPITYKYNEGHRDHIGFVAQEVEDALEASGLTTEQFAGLVIEKDVTLNPNYDGELSDEENKANETHYDTLYSLRYEEFISLLVKKVQNLQKQINELKGE